jgi:Holliday junction DNA helicase RuvA
MIAQLRGTLLEKHPNQAVIEAAGVGYDLTISVGTYASLPEQGREVRLRVHTHVREDAIQLFGFLTAEEKSLFEKLISVSGIGPKLAITALSGLAVDELVAAIGGGDVQKLVRLPGIGRKTAERIVLELRDKVGLPSGLPAPAGSAPAVLLSKDEEDVTSALMNLGAQRAAAETAARRAIVELGAAAGFERCFRRAMQLLR